MFKDISFSKPNHQNKKLSEIWDERYLCSHYLFGEEPVTGLKQLISQLKKGKCLDIAMGEGRNTVFLAKSGFQAEGIELSSNAIEKAKKLATKHQVSIEAKTQNLDFFLMPLMRYETVVMTYFKPLVRFFSEIRRGLVLGGTLFIEAYLTNELRYHANKHPNLESIVSIDECYRSNELLHYLKESFEVLYYRELLSDENECHTVVALVRKTKV